MVSKFERIKMKCECQIQLFDFMRLCIIYNSILKLFEIGKTLDFVMYYPDQCVITKHTSGIAFSFTDFFKIC